MCPLPESSFDLCVSFARECFLVSYRIQCSGILRGPIFMVFTESDNHLSMKTKHANKLDYAGVSVLVRKN